MADVDLAPAIDAWLAKLARGRDKGGRSASTVKHYTLHLSRIAPVGDDRKRLPAWRSSWTPAFFASARNAVTGGVASQLTHLTAWSSCCEALVEAGLLLENPLRQVKWPGQKSRGRDVRRIDCLVDVQQFVAAMPTLEYRAIAALREATGADWDAIEPMRGAHPRRGRAARLPAG